MSDTATIRRLLTRCEEYVRRLRAIEEVTEAEFRTNPGLQWQVERGLQLATQVCTDISDEIIFQIELEEPETAADSFHALRAAGLLSHELATRLVECVKFRNVLVHDYADLDLGLAYRHWREDLACYEQFCKVVRAWLSETEVET